MKTIKLQISFFIKTVFVLSVLILFLNINTNASNFAVQTSDSKVLVDTVLQKETSNVLEITEVPSSEYTNAIFLWFQLMHPSDIDNPFNGSPNTFLI